MNLLNINWKSNLAHIDFISLINAILQTTSLYKALQSISIYESSEFTWVFLQMVT